MLFQASAQKNFISKEGFSEVPLSSFHFVSLVHLDPKAFERYPSEEGKKSHL
jgi:hypothetical protein